MRVGGQLHALATLPLGKRPDTHCIGGWVGPRAGLDGCKKISPPTGIRSRDCPARSELLYQLRYPGPRICTYTPPICVHGRHRGTLLFLYLPLQMPLLSPLNIISNGMVCYFDLSLGRFYSFHMHAVLLVILGYVMQSHDRTPSGLACS
jgi:hypothetical protein